ncbi:hypothetical protein NLJ89_g10485 [Agrocybe chaxingu]|uniref:Uncharacterized protein n=1 Tax=Agrocybe chaxingu TaxID=84603 RepID=A0A9W8JR26_9AGAR|nr:hypothetical protein NLJ89_g10485 [Agrocybe chaxingu]
MEHLGQPKDPLIYLDVAIPDPNIEAPPKGAQKVPGYDPTSDFNAIRRFNKENWTDAQAKSLTKVILNLNPLQTDALGYHCKGELGKSLQDMIDALPLGNYGRVLHARSLGPLGYDVWLLKEATRNLGTNEMILIELILGRPAHEIRWLKTGYKLRYGKDLVDLIKSELSGTFEQCKYFLDKPPSTPYDAVDQAKVTADIEALNYAAKKKDELVFFDIFVNRSDRHLSAVIGGFSTQYKSLSRVVKKAFKGDVERALVYIVHRAKPKRDGRGIWQTAKLIGEHDEGRGDQGRSPDLPHRAGVVGPGEDQGGEGRVPEAVWEAA